MPSTTSSKRRLSEPSSNSQIDRKMSRNRTSGSNPNAIGNSNGTHKTDVFDQDQEVFFKAFEKPTQIYRTLRYRMLYSPIFLQRNLTYMRHRILRNNKKGKDFKVDNFLKIVEGNLETKVKEAQIKKNFFNIFFIGFSNGLKWADGTMAKVEIYISRVCQNKRKEVSDPNSKAYEGKSEVRTYESFNSIDGKLKCGVISIPSEAINIMNGHIVKSYILMVKVSLPKSAQIEPKSSSYENGDENNSSSTNNNDENDTGDEQDQPRLKKRKSTKENKEFPYLTEEEQTVFMGEFKIYDKDLKIPLGNTDFEMILNQSTIKSKRANSLSFNRMKGIKPDISWVVLDSNHQKAELFHNFDKERKGRLKISIRTSAIKVDEFKEPPHPMCSIKQGKTGEKKQETRVIYLFIYNNNKSQQTEKIDDLCCPWCSLNCDELYPLLKHLKLCHPRFNFLYMPIQNGARIDVSLNESYDGSYTGSAYNLVAQPPGKRDGPTKRTRVFALLVCKPKRPPHTLNEFMIDNEEMNDIEQTRSYITGHNRLYHHTTTSLPVHPKEIEVDSEGENDPEWLRVKSSMMIDEFTDVNEGEKEIMKLWNLHMLKHNYVGDCQIPLACKEFVEFQGKELIDKNLYRNFILHLTNLFDFGLLSPQGVYQTVQLLHIQMRNDNTAKPLRQNWKAHAPIINATNTTTTKIENVKNTISTPTSIKKIVNSTTTASNLLPII